MAFQALAARTGTVIVDERQRLIVRTALDGDDLDADLADPDATVVVYKGGRRLPELAAARGGRRPRRSERPWPASCSACPASASARSRELAAHGPASYLATVIVPSGRRQRRERRHRDLLRRGRPRRRRT